MRVCVRVCVCVCAVVTVPRAPHDVRIVSCSARVVQLEWKHVSNDTTMLPPASHHHQQHQQQQFIIEYNTSFEPHTWHVRHVSVSLSLSLSLSRARGPPGTAALIYDAISDGQLGVVASRHDVMSGSAVLIVAVAEVYNCTCVQYSR